MKNPVIFIIFACMFLTCEKETGPDSKNRGKPTSATVINCRNSI